MKRKTIRWFITSADGADCVLPPELMLMAYIGLCLLNQGIATAQLLRRFSLRIAHC
jgi:hypothetical protein